MHFFHFAKITRLFLLFLKKIVKRKIFLQKQKMFSKSKCKIADTDKDIFPKTFLEIISENQFCILAGSGRPGSEIIQPFSGSNMNFR